MTSVDQTRPQNDDENQQKVTRLASVSDTLRTEGIGWVLRRLRYRSPLTPAGRAVHAGLRGLLGVLLAVPRACMRILRRTPDSRDLLYAFYDLQVAPISYDVSWFAATADFTRRRMGLRRIHFVIVPGIKDGLREERKAYEGVVDPATRSWRLHNIVLPVLTLVPSFAGLSILPSRDAARALRVAAGHRVYPAHYEVALPAAHHPAELLTDPIDAGEEIGVLRSTIQGLRYVERWLESRISGRRLVTITIRDYTFMPARNSNLEAWSQFARRLDPVKYFPVFVLDTERTLDPSPSAIVGFEVFREASWNAWLRMALYELSFLNLGVNNGPLFMCAHNARTRFLIFKILTPSVPQTTVEFMTKLGFKIGGQLPFATPLQRLVWEDDTLQNIEREFVKLVHQIEESEPMSAGTLASSPAASATEASS
jgi:hypothetical protein